MQIIFCSGVSFFFSSRRRHTRWNCDWSSDVCSSDLPRTLGGVFSYAQILGKLPQVGRIAVLRRQIRQSLLGVVRDVVAELVAQGLRGLTDLVCEHLHCALQRWEIGRASCRERAEVSV